MFRQVFRKLTNQVAKTDKSIRFDSIGESNYSLSLSSQGKEALGDIVFLELKKPGSAVSRGGIIFAHL